MDSSRRVLGFRIALSAAAAVLVLAGASLNASGRDSGGIALAGVTGLLAVSSGVLYREWRLAVPLAGIASVVTIVIAQFNALQGDLVPQVAGLVLLAVGGLAGAITYRSFVSEVRQQAAELEGLNTRLGLKDQAFIAATSDVNGSATGDTAAITSGIAGYVGADFACCYLASADGRRYVPQPPTNRTATRARCSRRSKREAPTARRTRAG